MAMTRHKRLEVEHRQRLTAVKVDGEDDNDNKDDVGSQENEEVRSVILVSLFDPL